MTFQEERQAFLNRLVRGSLTVLRAQQGLTHHANYHEMCRLLARLKANYQVRGTTTPSPRPVRSYASRSSQWCAPSPASLPYNEQLSELVASDGYAEWISIVATFTIDSFHHWQWAANSVYYLLSLWSRLVASMPYLKGDTPSQLESFVPQVKIPSRAPCHWVMSPLHPCSSHLLLTLVCPSLVGFVPQVITAFINSRMELVRALPPPTPLPHGGSTPHPPTSQVPRLTVVLPLLRCGRCCATTTTSTWTTRSRMRSTSPSSSRRCRASAASSCSRSPPPPGGMPPSLTLR